MFYIDSETDAIYLTKGDTATLDITLMKDDEEYTMQEGDELYLAVRARGDFNYMILSKTSTTNSIEFYSADTFSLSAIEADYSITLIYANGNRDTFVTGKFNILGVCSGQSE